MTSPEPKPNYICVHHPGMEAESFAITGRPAFMQFDDNSTPKLAIEFGTDWIDFEETSLFGGSEATLHVWGLHATRNDLKNGLDKPLKPRIKHNEPLEDAAFAWFFATVGHRVDGIEVELLGSDRVKITAKLLDVTETTELSNTIVTADVVLVETDDITPKI